MAEILITLIEHFIDNKFISHITTNLFVAEIKKLYGNSLHSRMRNMFDVVSFESNSKDKRITSQNMENRKTDCFTVFYFYLFPKNSYCIFVRIVYI
jgi:hypothetical protein